MNKSELIDKTIKKAGVNVTKAAVEKILGGFVETVKEAVKNKDDVRLIGFGTFSSGFRNARVGRNPQTNQKMQIPACYYPKFRPGKEFKEYLN